MSDFVSSSAGGTMALEPGEGRLLVKVAAFVVVCIAIGGLWPWLIR